MTAQPPLPDTGPWSLARQFALAGSVVLLGAMVVVGSWVSARIEEAVVRNTANATALYMESFISPLSQELVRSDTLPPGARRALEEIFTNTPLGERVVSYKIWKDGGLVVEASDKALVGRRFPVSDGLRRAWEGEVSAQFEAAGSPQEAENQAEAALGLPLLEIYTPIREVWSGRVIGVAEFYEVATDLRNDLTEARRRSWIAVAVVLVSIGGLLYAIVLRGSRTIDRQQAELTDRVRALRELSDHNSALRLRVQEAAARASAMNDQALRRIGADLHDGPAQLLGFAALRLDNLRSAVAGDRGQEDLDQIERAVKDAIREVRALARGLSLPEIETRTPCDVLRGVVEAHAARTGTEVALHCDDAGLPPLSAAVKICLYRLAQEGLSNAWRHAEGKGQAVRLDHRGGRLTLTVRDQGPGYPETSDPREDDPGMGLSGLRDRVESLGGTLELRNRPPRGADPGGADLTMTLEVTS